MPGSDRTASAGAGSAARPVEHVLAAEPVAEARRLAERLGAVVAAPADLQDPDAVVAAARRARPDPGPRGVDAGVLHRLARQVAATAPAVPQARAPGLPVLHPSARAAAARAVLVAREAEARSHAALLHELDAAVGGRSGAQDRAPDAAGATADDGTADDPPAPDGGAPPGPWEPADRRAVRWSVCVLVASLAAGGAVLAVDGDVVAVAAPALALLYVAQRVLRFRRAVARLGAEDDFRAGLEAGIGDLSAVDDDPDRDLSEPDPSEPGPPEPDPSEPGPSEPGPSEPGPSEPGDPAPGRDLRLGAADREPEPVRAARRRRAEAAAARVAAEQRWRSLVGPGERPGVPDPVPAPAAEPGTPSPAVEVAETAVLAHERAVAAWRGLLWLLDEPVRHAADVVAVVVDLEARGVLPSPPTVVVADPGGILDPGRAAPDATRTPALGADVRVVVVGPDLRPGGGEPVAAPG